jgi:hypothetical protein
MRRLFLFVGILILFSSACSNSVPEIVQTEDEVEISESEQFTYYSGFNEYAFPAYQAMFIIEFEGSEYEWEYQLTTRTDGSFTEYSLNIVGVDTSMHPGAIRLVTDGNSSWMIGPGTDNHCFRFPNSMDIKMDFFTPDDLIASLLVNAVLEESGEETIEGQETDHYQTRESSLANWSNVSLDIWPLFDAGVGKLGFRYIIQEIGPQEIEPITGCEINYPVPENSYDLTRFPGLISFKNTQDAETLINFYLEEMPLNGWEMQGQVESQDNLAQIVFQQANNELVISITSKDGSTFVEIFEE